MQASIILLCLFANQVLAIEPNCSKFTYDEALLEKMIRTEVKFEQFQGDFKQLREDVKLAVRQMTDDMQNMMNTVKVSLICQECQNQTTYTKVEQFMNDSKDELDQQERRVNRLSSDLSDFYTDIHKNLTGNYVNITV